MLRLLRLNALLALAVVLSSGSYVNAVDINVTTNADSGVGSLRDALNTAAAGDRIVFDLPGTITLASDLPAIPNDISFSNPLGTIIDRSGMAALSFNGSAVDITGLNIVGGVAPDLDDAIASSATTVFGDGTVDGNVVVSGTLTPGSNTLDVSNGTFTVNGDLDLTGAEVRTGLFSDGSTASSDLIVVNGTVDVTGANIFPALSGGAFVPGQSFLLLDSTNPIVGSFANLPDVLEILDLDFLRLVEDGSLGTDDFGVTVEAISFTTATTGLNQTSAAEILDNRLPLGQPSLIALANGTSEQLLAATDQLSGSIYPSLLGGEINHVQSNLESIRDRVLSPFPMYRDQPRLRHWVRGYGLHGEVSRDDQGSLGYRQELGGLEIGLGLFHRGPLAIHGFAHLATGKLESQEVDQRADIDSYRIGGTVEFSSQQAYILLTGGAGVQDYAVRRSLSAFTGSTFAESSFDGTTQFGYGEIGTTFSRFDTYWSPYLSLNATRVEIDPITETGDGDYALSNAGGGGSSLRGSLGMSIDKWDNTPLGTAHTRIRVGWLHEYLTESETFASELASGGTLVDRGVSAGRDWGFARVQIDMGTILGGQFSTAYQGHFNGHSAFSSLVTGVQWTY